MVPENPTEELVLTLEEHHIPALVDLICAHPDRDAIILSILPEFTFVPTVKSRRDPRWAKMPFGKVTDVVIAKEMGVTRERVRQVRNELGIPTFSKNKVAAIDWDKQPLGQISDDELARKIGISTAIVKEHRKARGILASSYHDWDKVPLGEFSDSTVADMIGSNGNYVGTIRRQKGIPASKPIIDNWDDLPLGKIPDKVLAERLGCSASWVASQRLKRGIPASEPKKSNP